MLYALRVCPPGGRRNMHTCIVLIYRLDLYSGCELLRSMILRVCQSDRCLSRGSSGFAMQTRLNGSRSCLGWRLLGFQINTELDGTHMSPNFPTDSMRPSLNFFGRLLKCIVCRPMCVKCVCVCAASGCGVIN